MEAEEDGMYKHIATGICNNQLATDILVWILNITCIMHIVVMHYHHGKTKL